MSNILRIANKLGNGDEFKVDRGIMTQCPCHKDQDCSLRLWETNDGSVRLKCQAGCRTKDIFRSIRGKGLLPDSTPKVSLLKSKPKSASFKNNSKRRKKKPVSDPLIRNFPGITSTELQSLAFEEPVTYIYPILTTGTYMMMYAAAGVGKSLVSSAIGVALTRAKAKGIKIGPWEIMKSCGVVLLDTELPLRTIQKRIKFFEKSMGATSQERPLKVISSMQFQKDTGKSIKLSEKDWQNYITNHFIENREYKLLIVDNLSTIEAGVSEVSKQSWDPINQFCLELRNMGVSVILIHHSTKNGEDRGHSSRRDNMDTIIKLERISDTSDVMEIKAEFQKSRNLKAGEGATVKLKLEGNEETGFSIVEMT